MKPIIPHLLYLAKRFVLEKVLLASLEHKSQVVFLVEEVMRQAAVAEVDISGIVPGDAAGGEGAALAVAWAIQEQARADGAAVGLEFAERFRYTRFHPMIETLLEAQKGP